MTPFYSTDATPANNFDFVRFLLATAVVFCHSYAVYDGNVNRDPLWVWSGHQLSLGTAAVNFFFVISGFLVTQSWDREPQYRRFLQKRLLRLYPGFVVVSALGAVLFGPLGRGWPPDFPAYWSTVGIRGWLYMTATLREPILPPTFMHSPLPNSLNASLWSISYEFVSYQVIPLVAIGSTWVKPTRSVAVLAVVLVLNIVHYPAYQVYSTTGALDAHLIPYYPLFLYELLLGWEHLLLPFAAGMCFYTYRHRIPYSPYGLLVALVVLGFTLRTGVGFEIAQALFGAYGLFYFIFQQRISFSGFARYGDFSYGIYLYGWPLLQLILLYASVHSVGSLFAWTMAFAVPIAAVSWHLVEKPFLRFKRADLLQWLKGIAVARSN